MRTRTYAVHRTLGFHFIDIPKLLMNWRKRTTYPDQDRCVRRLLLLETADYYEIRDESDTIEVIGDAVAW